MIRQFAAAALVLISGWVGLTAAQASEPSSEPPPRYTIEQLMASDAFGGLSFSADNSRLLFTSKRSGVANVYVMPVAGGEATHLIGSPRETVRLVGPVPGDERVLYVSDRGGDELDHLHVREADGSSRDLTPGEGLQARFAGWAQDGSRFYVSTNERDPRFFDLYEHDAATYERRLIFENDAGYQVRAVGPGGLRIGLSRIHDNANTDAFLFDTTTGELRKLTPEAGDIVSTPQAFSRDGRHLFLTTDEGREFQHLVRLDLDSGETVSVLKLDWDVTSAEISRDGRYLVVSVNQDARTVVRLFDARTLELLATIAPQSGTISDFALAHDAPLAAVLEEGGDNPGSVDLIDLETGARTPVLDALAPQVRRQDLVAGDVVRFASYDGVSIPGVLYAPHGARPGDGRPAAIWVHGGPGDESRIGYKPLTQYLVNHGYVVYEINNRGSSGSGKTFYHLDDHRHGDADLDDVVAARGMLADTGYVDPERIAIMGGSYGGYMTLAGLAFRPEAFAAGVDLYGVSNWLRLLPNTPPWWDDLRRLLKTEMGDWEVEQDYLRDISPVFHAGRIVRPLLVLQGANDPRVLPVESEDIVARARANGTPVEYIVFDDEGHGFEKKANQIVAYRAILDFLDEHLGRPAEPEA